MNRPALLTVGALAATLALTACGSSKPDAPTTPQTAANSPAAKTGTAATRIASSGPSHADFVGNLNAICRNANGKVDRITAAADETDYDSLATALEQVIPVFDRGQARLNELEVPAADADAFGRYRQSISRSAGLSRRLADALRAHDDTKIGTLGEALDAEKQHKLSAALDLGADDCGGV